MREPVTDKAQPVALGAGAEQDLGHGQADQLGVAEPGRTAWSQARAEQVVDGDVQCGDEVVETGEACTGLPGGRRCDSNASSRRLVPAVTARRPQPDSGINHLADGPQAREDDHGQALLVAEQAEQQVLGADAVVAEPASLPLGLGDGAGWARSRASPDLLPARPPPK